MGTIDTRISDIEALLRQERERGRINNLENLAISQRHRKFINENWQAIQAELAPISQAIKDLTALPEAGVIRWAQAMLAMPNLSFMEIDTTGLEGAEIIRFTTVNADEQVLEDFLIKPTGQLTAEASNHNGLTQQILEEQGLSSIAEAWKRMQAALSGKYIISYSQEWDVKQLNAMAAKHGFEPMVIIGEDLQRRATKYYNGEYYLNLFKLAERLGYVMPEEGAQTAIHRATAQVRILKAMASAVTDVRPPRPAVAAVSTTTSSTNDDGGLGDLDDHPF